MDEEINNMALWVYYFDVQIHIVLMMFSLSTNAEINLRKHFYQLGN